VSEAKKGSRITTEDAAERDRSKMAVLVTRPAEAEVEGQEIRERVICPWCGATGVVSGLPEEEAYVQCGACGQYFEVGTPI
jgi:transcription elongation factor Elf1